MLSSINRNICAVIPASAFGRKTATAIRQSEHLMLAAHQCGLMDGGCLILAQALQHWSKGEIGLGVSRRIESGVIDHWFGAIPTSAGFVTLDADGLQTADEMLEKMHLLERTTRQTLDVTGVDPSSTEMLQDEALSQRIANHLERRLGPYVRWRSEMAHLPDGALTLSDGRHASITFQSGVLTLVITSPSGAEEAFQYTNQADATQDLLLLWQDDFEPSGHFSRNGIPLPAEAGCGLDL